MSSARDVRSDLREFIRAHFSPGNVAVAWTNADDIVIADYDLGPSYPEVAVVSEDFVAIGGGTTQFTAMDAAGGGPVQEGYSLVQIDCWGGTVNTDAVQTAGVHPDEVAVQLAREVIRAINANAGGPSGYKWVSATGPSTANDTTDDGSTEFRETVQARLGYET